MKWIVILLFPLFAHSALFEEGPISSGGSCVIAEADETLHNCCYIQDLTEQICCFKKLQDGVGCDGYSPDTDPNDKGQSPEAQVWTTLLNSK